MGGTKPVKKLTAKQDPQVAARRQAPLATPTDLDEAAVKDIDDQADQL